MPELPEVETVVRDLRPILVGNRLASIRRSAKHLRKKWNKSWEPLLIGRRVTAIRRRGKWILIDLDANGMMVIHLGMTGQLTVVPCATDVALHTHLIFTLDGEKELRFRDVRRFGSVTLFVDSNAWMAAQEGKLGPEPFELTAKSWRASLERTGRCLKAVLLDQAVVAGVGNIYADESLHRARIHPKQIGRMTSPRQAEQLRKAIVEVIQQAIEGRGSTIRDYVGGSGLRGGYQDQFRVYGRSGKPCLKCRTAIECIRLAGRSTHYCPHCQSEAAAPTAGCSR